MTAYKEATKNSYEATAEEFTRNIENLAPMQSIERFLKLLPAKPKIIDIGCGPGRDAKIFTEKGASVLGVDFCQNLIDIAKVRAPLAQFQLMDIETGNFPNAAFDGVWSACTLSHIPKKNLSAVLKKIHSCLKPKGYLYLALKKGVGEIFEKDARYQGDHKKFWAFYEEQEISKFLEDAKFKILECCTVEKNSPYQTGQAIRLFCQKI